MAAVASSVHMLAFAVLLLCCRQALALTRVRAGDSAPHESKPVRSYDRGFLLDHELEDWLGARGWLGCSVPEVHPSVKLDWGDWPRIQRRGPSKSSASLQDFVASAGPVLTARGSNNNNAIVMHKLNKSLTSLYLADESVFEPREETGGLPQLFPELGVVGLTGFKMFDYSSVAPEYTELLGENAGNIGGTTTDIFAPSRNGFSFHRHYAFKFQPLRGRKLFILAPSSSSVVKELPTGLRESPEEEQFFFEMQTLPSIVLLQKYEYWFRTTAGLQFCVVEEGDTLMVPHFWWHFTASVGHSLSFSSFSQTDVPLQPLATCPQDKDRGGQWRWDRFTQGSCSSFDGQEHSLEEVCSKLPPRPSRTSVIAVTVCDVAYRYLSAWCADAAAMDQPSESNFGAEEVLEDSLDRFVNAAAEGGKETVHIVRLLVGAWTSLAGLVGDKTVGSKLQHADDDLEPMDSKILKSLMVNESRTTHEVLAFCVPLRDFLFGRSPVPESLLSHWVHP